MDLRKTILPFFIWAFAIFPIFGQEADFRTRYVGLDSLLNEKSFFGNHLTGFILFEPDSQRVLFEKNSHINFIPASIFLLASGFNA